MKESLLKGIPRVKNLCNLCINPLYHTSIMIDDSHKMVFLIYYEYSMNLVLVHDALYLGDFGVWIYHLRSNCHDVAHSLVEEFCLPFLHSTTDVTIGNQSDDLLVLIERYS